MRKIILHTFILSLYLLPLSAQEIQNTSNIWYFGNNAGLDFNTSPPSALTDGQLNTQEGVATISDNNGALLFYTDGITVWDRSHQPMPGGDGTLDGHWSSTQSAVIVPNLSNPNVYYIFTTDELGGSNGLRYTTIDMTLPGNGSLGMPMGDVVSGELNIQLVTPVTEKITAVLKPDLKGYWVIAHGWNNNHFYAYEVTCAGINTSPVISAVGHVHAGGFENINAVGYMKATIDGQKLALVNRNYGSIDVYDFDNNTGVVSNELEISPNDPLIYGIEFSYSGDHLYIGGSYIISRYTFGSGELVNITIDIPSALNGINTVRALQLGPDENIYVSVRDRQYISAIYDSDGNNPMLTVNAIYLNPDGVGRNCRFGLPNIFYFDFFPPDSIVLTTCPNSQVEFNGEFYLSGSINEINFIDNEGCDSTVILLVETYNVNNEILESEACEGGYYDYNGNQIPAGSQQSFIYTDINGCDSTVTVVVEIYEGSNEILEFEACEGGNYDYNGNQIPAGSLQSFIYTDINGCDSTVTVVVEIYEGSNEILEFEACEGGYYDYNGNQIPAGSQQSFIYTDINGCDSTVTIVVNISDVVEENMYVEACEGDFFIFEGVAVEAGTNVQISTTDPEGCELLINLFVEALPLDQTQISFTNCSDSTFTYFGTSIEIGDEATFIFQNQFGCDSLVTVKVVSESNEATIEVALCEGEYYTLNNIEYPAGTDTSFYFIDQNGCDSIIILQITLNPEINFILISEESCWSIDNGSISVQAISGGLPPYEFSFDGQNFYSQSSFNDLAPGMYHFLIRDANNCVHEQEIEIMEIPEIKINDNYPTFSCDIDSFLLVIELLSGDPNDVSWKWPDGSTNNYIFISQPGNYQLEISNQCQTLIENISIQTDEDVLEDLIYIPNAFSPNDDGVNDVFRLFPGDDVEILSYEIHIFNRWGAPLFVSSDINFSWDGIFNDQELNPGVYVWWLEATIISCKREIEVFKKGDITLFY